MSVVPRELTPQETQLVRLLEALRPGQAAERYGGWLREMRTQFGQVDERVLRKAVTTCLALELHLPTPAYFAHYVNLAQAALERAKRERRAKLETPPPPTAEEQREAAERTERAKQAARARLPQHLRKEYRR